MMVITSGNVGYLDLGDESRQAYSSELFRLFIKHNPHVRFFDDSKDTGWWLVGHAFPYRDVRDRSLSVSDLDRACDHGECVKLMGVGDGSYGPSHTWGDRCAVVCHPYGCGHIDDIHRWGFAVGDLGQDRSWYKPGRSHLWVVGRWDALETICVGYDVPTLEEFLEQLR